MQELSRITLKEARKSKCDAHSCHWHPSVHCLLCKHLSIFMYIWCISISLCIQRLSFSQCRFYLGLLWKSDVHFGLFSCHAVKVFVKVQEIWNFCFLFSSSFVLVGSQISNRLVQKVWWMSYVCLNSPFVHTLYCFSHLDQANCVNSKYASVAITIRKRGHNSKSL